MDDDDLWWLLSLTILVIILIQIWWMNRGLPPGPIGLPFFGYYFSVNSDMPYLTFNRLKEKYGDVTSFRTVGGTLFVVLNSMSALREAFVTRSEEFIGRPTKQNFLNWIDDGYGLVQTEGDVWKDQKRFFLTTTKKYGFGKSDVEIFAHEMIRDLVNDLHGLSEEPVRLSCHLSHVTGNIISRILCGKTIPKNDPEFLELNSRNYDFVLFFADRRFLLVGLIFEFIIRITRSGRQMMKAKKVLEKFAQNVVQEHVRNLDPDNPKDFIDSYLVHIKQLKNDDNSFNLTRLEKVFLTNFLEATETVSSTICSLLAELSKYPEVQEKAQKELDDVVGRERLPSWTDKKDLPYVDAVITELYRISIVFFIGPYYSNFEETTLRGYRIPKRSFIIANFYSVHNDPLAYPDPEKFDPGRFLNVKGRRIKQQLPIPFGIGKRSCIGESLASMEVFLIITAILQNFTLYPAGEDVLTLKSRSKST